MLSYDQDTVLWILLTSTCNFFPSAFENFSPFNLEELINDISVTSLDPFSCTLGPLLRRATSCTCTLWYLTVGPVTEIWPSGQLRSGINSMVALDKGLVHILKQCEIPPLCRFKSNNCLFLDYLIIWDRNPGKQNVGRRGMTVSSKCIPQPYLEPWQALLIDCSVLF